MDEARVTRQLFHRMASAEVRLVQRGSGPSGIRLPGSIVLTLGAVALLVSGEAFATNYYGVIVDIDADTYVNTSSTYSGSNFGSDQHFWAGTNADGTYNYGLVKFDIGDLQASYSPSLCEITDCNIYLYVDSVSGFTQLRQMVLANPWYEGSVTADNLNATPASGAYNDWSISSSASGWVDDDIDDFCAAWFENSISNHGLRLYPRSSNSVGNKARFRSDEYSSSTYDPYLEVDLSCDDCTSGSCCNTSTGSFRPSGYACATQNSYTCPDGTSCGDDVYRLEEERRCTGSSSSCPSTWYTASETVYDSCGSDEVCQVGDSSCNYTSSCVDCTSGDCCNTATQEYRPSGYVCATSTDYECLEGTGCGDDVFRVEAERRCSGSSSSCPSTWHTVSEVVHDNCSSDEVCQAGDPSCNSSSSCWECETGDCCNTATQEYRPSGYVCATSVTYECLDGSDCGDDVYRVEEERRCTGSSSSCPGTWHPVSESVADNCSGDEVCVQGDPSCNDSPPCSSDDDDAGTDDDDAGVDNDDEAGSDDDDGGGGSTYRGACGCDSDGTGLVGTVGMLWLALALAGGWSRRR